MNLIDIYMIIQYCIVIRMFLEAALFGQVV